MSQQLPTRQQLTSKSLLPAVKKNSNNVEFLLAFLASISTMPEVPGYVFQELVSAALDQFDVHSWTQHKQMSAILCQIVKMNLTDELCGFAIKLAIGARRSLHEELNRHYIRFLLQAATQLQKAELLSSMISPMFHHIINSHVSRMVDFGDIANRLHKTDPRYKANMDKWRGMKSDVKMNLKCFGEERLRNVLGEFYEPLMDSIPIAFDKLPAEALRLAIKSDQWHLGPKSVGVHAPASSLPSNITEKDADFPTWLVAELQELKDKYPDDRFEAFLSPKTIEIKSKMRVYVPKGQAIPDYVKVVQEPYCVCLDCKDLPPVKCGPVSGMLGFNSHLLGPKHKLIVKARVDVERASAVERAPAAKSSTSIKKSGKRLWHDAVDGTSKKKPAKKARTSTRPGLRGAV